MKNKTNYLAF